MLSALPSLLFMLIGGDSLQFYLVNIEKPVKEAVHDKDRRKTVIDEGEALAENLSSLEEEINRDFEELVEVHARYDSTSADFDAVSAKLLEHQRESVRLILDARDVMHAQMTREEWESVFK